MIAKPSVMLFATGWIILACLVVPAQASGTAAQATVAGPEFTTGTFPILDNDAGVRQAHVAWLAKKEEAGMQATIGYLASVNDSTGKLSSMMSNYKAIAGALRSAGTYEAIDAKLEDLCAIAGEFREETGIQMAADGTRWVDLRNAVQGAVEGSPDVRQLEVQYWQARTEHDLAQFDLLVQQDAGAVSALQENGYEITAAQEKLTEIVTMRSNLETALRYRNDAGIEQAHKKIHATSIEFAQLVRDLRAHSSPEERVRHVIDQGLSVMTRAGMVNADLKTMGTDTGGLEDLVTAGNAQLSLAQEGLESGNLKEGKSSLSQFGTTAVSLRDAYRGVLSQDDLKQESATGVLSVAQSLQTTITQIEVL